MNWGRGIFKNTPSPTTISRIYNQYSNAYKNQCCEILYGPYIFMEKERGQRHTEYRDAEAENCNGSHWIIFYEFCPYGKRDG